ncbi:MAG: ABC transporter permease [Methylobacteriaceae bacterium]|nr:ABC transporter permease [Methylobacteriaceae bacterium]MBV9703853.1 ABC transporter permease [Methylobacteriaceae bacterium]
MSLETRLRSVGKEARRTQAAPVGDPVLDTHEKTIFEKLIGTQAFWVTMALLIICVVMSIREPVFATEDNFFNITRNFAFIGVMALGMTPVIITGGIDLSVGSVMGLVAIVCGLVLLKQPIPWMPDWWNDATWTHSWWMALALGLLAGVIVGLINGVLIAYVGLPPFVVTLGMLSIARAVAVVLSGNRMLYDFRPDQAPKFKIIGGGQNLGLDQLFGADFPFRLSNPFLILVVLTITLGIVLRMTGWGRHIFAIGGNEQAANLTGVPVKRVKVQAYVICSLSAALAAILSVGWSGSANNSLGQSYELLAIASAVIGGANLMGGEGGAYAAFIGSALIFVIRNSLLMAGVDSNWQGLFVGSFIILAVVLERIRGKRRE